MSMWQSCAALCDSCPAKSECLESAMLNHERFGVWGGVLFDSEGMRRIPLPGVPVGKRRKSLPLQRFPSE
jgi:hypothetical protein